MVRVDVTGQQASRILSRVAPHARLNVTGELKRPGGTRAEFVELRVKLRATLAE